MHRHDSTVERCACGRMVSRVPAPFGLPWTTKVEDNTERTADKGALHRARMRNKRHVESQWPKVAAGEMTYDPGELPEKYQPDQYLKEKYS